VTVCLREAIGTAVLLVASGTKGNRCALPHARFKFVPLEISDEILSLTDSEEIIHYQAEFENVRQTFIRALSDATGQSTDKIVRDMEKRLSLTAQEAVEYGLIDQILQRDAD
jgi:ATP-dependent Clp protease protease subunit